jgi:hypothetical protein
MPGYYEYGVIGRGSQPVFFARFLARARFHRASSLSTASFGTVKLRHFLLVSERT